MKVRSIDHFVLVVRDAEQTCSFYSRVLGMVPRQMPSGRWALHFGDQKINLQQVGLSVDPLARRPTPGAADFCLLTDVPIADVVRHLEGCGVEIFDGPVERMGAAGPILSVYFYDPDDNMVEISNRLLSPG
ncbi:VOC family protein [Microvirga arsenatis]|uniref:VOC family protein n=1 Tax=Microvirga arsenatis TaxID=2692265 RepID=A0ABW9Z2G2_9HYPH|nr:VOC family protein [Microvirga arsenatis]NBJ10272.1 VOC family protein [Microvirga arsenatis]NBJ24829.1 VOC family protein [Microvirga arsenatis]